MTQLTRTRHLKATLRDTIRNAILESEEIYRFYLKVKYKTDKPKGYPNASWSNAVLRNRQEWERAVRQVETLGLPPANGLPKNWDSLAALDCILRTTSPEKEDVMFLKPKEMEPASSEAGANRETILEGFDLVKNSQRLINLFGKSC